MTYAYSFTYMILIIQARYEPFCSAIINILYGVFPSKNRRHNIQSKVCKYSHDYSYNNHCDNVSAIGRYPWMLAMAPE